MNITIHLRHFLLTTVLMGPLAAATVYTEGHGDVTATYTNGELHLSYRLDSVGHVDINGTPDDLLDDATVGSYTGGALIPGAVARKRFEADEVVVYVPGPAVARPAGTAWDFIGNDAGDPTWYIPQVQDFAKPWLGFSSEELVASEWTSYTLSLVSVSPPSGGEFALTTTGTFGGNTLLWTSYPTIDGTDTFNVGLNTHAHANWWFSEPGLYGITLRASGVHITDGPKEATATFTIGVQAVPVPEPSAALMLLAGAAALLRRQ